MKDEPIMSAMSVPVSLGSSESSAPSGASASLSSASPGRRAPESVADVSAPVPSPKPSLGERLGQWFGRSAGKAGGQGGGPKDGRDGKVGKGGKGGKVDEADGKAVPAKLSPRAQSALRRQLTQCLSARLTDSAANEAARDFMTRYSAASREEQLALLTVVADICASDGNALAEAGKDGDGASAKRAGSGGLAGALGSARVRFLKRFNALPDGLPFLVRWRADMLDHRAALPGLAALEDDLGSLFSTWFDVGLLELHPITWDSPASLLEKLMRYEAVHEISSWADLRNRLDSDRRCYAFFHPRMPREPLIFVEVAFVPDMAADVHSLLDEKAPLEDLRRIRWAIFYSISNTQPGLRGVSFGNFLLKRVIDELHVDFPKLRNFATLSPIPGFTDWLRQLSPQALAEALGPKRMKRVAQEVVQEVGQEVGQEAALASQISGAQMVAWLQTSPERKSEQALRRSLGEALAAHYLARETVRGQPRDPVARFHLGNGARVERINWHADLSKKGAKQSCGMMVNYLYEPDELDANLQRLIDGEPALGRAVSRLL